MDERLVEAAQALLTGYDTALSRQWREEDRRWRTEDMCWRQKELHFSDAQHTFLEQQRQWRQQDTEQRHLDNARALWARVVEKNRRDVEEKAEQLKAISTLAALISGFALSAFLQFDFGDYVDKSGAVLPLFGVTMALTVGLETICVIICSLMLVSVFKTGQSYMSDEEEAEFMQRCKAFADNYSPGDRPPAPARSFAMHWAQRCEQSWRRAFLLFGLGGLQAPRRELAWRVCSRNADRNAPASWELVQLLPAWCVGALLSCVFDAACPLYLLSWLNLGISMMRVCRVAGWSLAA
eukprot:GHRQ01029727.1.p1 GENE.GHRQ01029727.1~~GHRQ01029727.1.p1  ORF type:complete len:295 (+),score=71.27 GHRQ01029727.1:368-1252(+)